MIPVNNNGRLLLLVETPSNSQVRTLRAATSQFTNNRDTYRGRGMIAGYVQLFNNTTFCLFVTSIIANFSDEYKPV